MTAPVKSSQYLEIAGDISAGRGQLGMTVFLTTGAAVTQSGTFAGYYSRYVLNPTAPITFTLGTIGTAANELQPGYTMSVLNVSAANTITLVGTTGTIRPGGSIDLIAETAPASWRTAAQASSAGLRRGTGAPAVVPGDTAGAIYVDSATGTIYTFAAGVWSPAGGGSTTVDPLSIAGAGTVPDPYRALATTIPVTSAEANLKDLAVSLDNSGQLVAARGMTLVAPVGSATNARCQGSFSNIGFSVSNSTCGDSRYCGSCNLVYSTLLSSQSDTFLGADAAGISYSTATAGLGFQPIIICKDLDGVLQWAAYVTAGIDNWVGEPYHDCENELTYFPFSQRDSAANVYDWSNLRSPLFTIPAPAGNLYNGVLLVFDSRGRYAGDTTKPIRIINGQVNTISSVVRIGTSLYVAGAQTADTTANYNVYSATPPQYTVTISGARQPLFLYGSPTISKYNLTTGLFEWTTTMMNFRNDVDQCSNSVVHSANGKLLFSANYFVPVTQTTAFGRVWYADGTTLVSDFDLPTTNSTNALFVGSRRAAFVCEIDQTSGAPIWFTVGVNNTQQQTHVASMKVDLSDCALVSTQFNGTADMRRPLVQSTIIATTAGAAITSGALFAATMHRRPISGPGIVSGTIFNYVDPSNGTLSTAVTFNTTAGVFEISNAPTETIGVVVNTTAGSSSVTSAAAFLTSHNGAYLVGAGVPIGARFRYLTASTGTISMPATATAAPVCNITTMRQQLSAVGRGTFVMSVKPDGEFGYMVVTSTNNGVGDSFVGTMLLNGFDKYNRSYWYIDSNGATTTFNNGDVTSSHMNQIVISPTGVVQSLKIGLFTNGVLQTPRGLWCRFETNNVAPFTLDGITIPTIVGFGDTYFYWIDDTATRRIGIAAANALAGATVPVVTAGGHTTTAALTAGRRYYIDPSTAALTTDNTYGIAAGVAMPIAGTVRLLLQ